MQPIIQPEHRVINGLSYLSVIFMPVGFPLLVLIISAFTPLAPDVRRSARHALVLQLLPFISFIVLMLGLGGMSIFTGVSSRLLVGGGFLVTALLVLISAGLYLYNIYRAIRIFAS
ncbi:hypothetical protein FC99_GL001639 [Levilactobacillus koreensis JCM 16448]|uniref:DUF4870 domain-containing protein n=1 Tax=Levilactobacillus koreensis TaxID=637971 RepID=A0AAC8ZGS8_9LACO|nr:hypothetical protein [Levilactobacillus koreensis]AKP65128.1 hypothetical protein ABN16_09015 [Levilactobacillus koreensis]KRK91673.1 hypothetical protein FC99_GL001639 [Levilactobacillus koreensis JCM 16448]